jgi:hypothetical protein
MAKVSGKRIGSISQAMKVAQARRDSKVDGIAENVASRASESARVCLTSKPALASGVVDDFNLPRFDPKAQNPGCACSYISPFVG